MKISNERLLSGLKQLKIHVPQLQKRETCFIGADAEYGICYNVTMLLKENHLHVYKALDKHFADWPKHQNPRTPWTPVSFDPCYPNYWHNPLRLELLDWLINKLEIEQLNLTLEILKWVRAFYMHDGYQFMPGDLPLSCHDGICGHFKTIYGYVSGDPDWKNIDFYTRPLIALMDKWPKYSGDPEYPVPSVVADYDAKTQYQQSHNKWEGEYGALRLELLTWCIDELEKQLCHLNAIS